MNIKENKTRLNDVCFVALQILDRLEYVHSKDVIHKDIKPFNFIFGKKDPNILYIIDFGLSKKYRSSRTGKHIKFNKKKKVNGSYRYMSINTNKGYEQSRKDDLESLGYMLIYLAKKCLPWSDIVDDLKLSRKEQMKKILAKKIRITPEELCFGLPLEFSEYIKYCRKLEFEDDPNYDYLKHLFIAILKRNEQIMDERYICLIQFSWLRRKKSGEKAKSNPKGISHSKYSASKKRKESFYKRLFRKIKENIDTEKSMELPKLRYSNLVKFTANNICIIPNNVNRNYKKKTENNITSKISLRKKTKQKINENKSNIINKINIKVKPKIKITFNESGKMNYTSILSRNNINNKRIINDVQVKTKYKDFFKSMLNKNKIIHKITKSNDYINMNQTGGYSLDLYSRNQQKIRYYKTLKERNEIKKLIQKTSTQTINKPISPTVDGNIEKTISPIKKNTFKQIHIKNRNFDNLNLYNISLRKKSIFFSSNLDYNNIYY